ncbi:MAG TPA: hypothetical protein VFQ59_00225 [Candidatus Paceibacterota bacterium]|nr:hypothetical protein [Candidatus Paceibacterota bacterium]
MTTEQQNIIDRLRVTTDPAKVMWIHLIALDGNILRRMPVKNKVTSSGKRLEPVIAADANGHFLNVPGKDAETAEMLQADGTFGSSDNYIFWFDPTMRYHQWGTAGGLGYLLTDYPINLEDPSDKITGLYNVSKVALEWQQEQEKRLRKQEGPAYEKYRKELDSFEQKLKENNQSIIK